MAARPPWRAGATAAGTVVTCSRGVRRRDPHSSHQFPASAPSPVAPGQVPEAERRRPERPPASDLGLRDLVLSADRDWRTAGHLPPLRSETFRLLGDSARSWQHGCCCLLGIWACVSVDSSACHRGPERLESRDGRVPRVPGLTLGGGVLDLEGPAGSPLGEACRPAPGAHLTSLCLRSDRRCFEGNLRAKY